MLLAGILVMRETSRRALLANGGDLLDSVLTPRALARCAMQPDALGPPGPGFGFPSPHPEPPPPTSAEPPPGPRLVFIVYNSEFQPAGHGAAFPGALRSAQAAGESRPHLFEDLKRGRSMLMAAATGGSGDCAYVVLRHRLPPEPPGSLAFEALVGALAVLFMFGPTSRRLTRLARSARQLASGGYVDEVAPGGGAELDDLAEALNGASREVRARLKTLEQNEAALREYLANTTHDVMTPLSVLQGHLAELSQLTAASQSAVPSEGSESERLVAAALDECEYLSRLVHNLNARARIDASAELIRSDRVDLAALVRRVAARYVPIAERLGASLDFGVPGEETAARGDVVLIERALGNLVDNALRHNARGGHAAILLSRNEGSDDGNGLVLEVRDDGPGMGSEAERSLLLSRGRRGSAARQRHPDGMGLGLQVVTEVGGAPRLAPVVEQSVV